MMKQYYPEEELVDKVQRGEMNMQGYVTHHSKEWDEEYEEFCQSEGLDPEEESSAEDFMAYKDAQITQAHVEGEI